MGLSALAVPLPLPLFVELGVELGSVVAGGFLVRDMVFDEAGREVKVIEPESICRYIDWVVVNEGIATMLSGLGLPVTRELAPILSADQILGWLLVNSQIFLALQSPHCFLFA